MPPKKKTSDDGKLTSRESEIDSKQINTRFYKIENVIQDLSDSLTTRYKELNSKLAEVIKSQTFLNATFEEIDKRLKKVEDEEGDLMKENRSLKAQLMHLVNEINLLKESVNTVEQYSRDSLEIRAVP